MRKVSAFLSAKKKGLLTGVFALLALAGTAQTHWYVSPAGNDAGNGLSPATAKLTIQNAINTAVSGDVIHIDPGTYTARITVTKPLSLLGADEAGCILSGTGLVGTGKGIQISSGVTNVTIKQLTVQNFAGANGNSDAGIYATANNHNLRIEHVTIRNNVGGSGFYGGGPVDNVTLDYVTSSGHTVAARGIVIWNGLKSNITITNCEVFNNNCCGIELQDGSASGVVLSNNKVYNNADNGIGLVGLTGSVGPNMVSNNILTDNGRFGIEVKNPDGGTTVSNNTVNRTVPFSTELRDGAGISVYRRGVLPGNVDVPTGVKVLNNIVSGYTQPSASEGFGIVLEGMYHTVTGNHVSGCDVGIQQQAGNPPYPADGDQTNKADFYFGRGNAQLTCGNLVAGNVLSSNVFNLRNTGTFGGAGFITNTTTGKTYCSIQAAINDPLTLAGHTLELTSGVYNEQVLVNKKLTIRGVGSSQPVVDFIGTPLLKKTVFDISVSDVTIENLTIRVDLTKMASAIIASGSNISNLTIKNNRINAYGSSNANSTTFGDRNAVSINYASFRNNSGGVNNIQFTGNTINGLANDAFGVSRYFRSGVSTDESGGVFTGNTITSVNHDILARFGSNGNITITNNLFNGGGVELDDMNAAAGILTVSGNSFDAAYANILAPGAAVLRLRNNYNAKTTLVTGNTFSNHEWAVSMENYNTVTLDNNSFTPLAGSGSYHHVTINTKCISSNSATVLQKTIGAVITRNIFNGSGVPGGTALSFHNHDNDAASFGSFAIGGAGTENTFNAGIDKFISLDNQSGSSSAATFPGYTAVIGSIPGALTTMSPWATAIDARNNLFDAGSGLHAPAVMTVAELLALEDKIQHRVDAATLGLVTVKANQLFVTVNSFAAPVTTASIQRGVDAASNNFLLHLGAGVFTENVIVTKEIEIRGQGETSTKIIPAISSPNNCGSASICAGSSNVFLVQANNVTIDHLTIDGDNPSISSATIVGGADVDARNGIITNHAAGLFSNLTVHHVTIRNIFLRGIYASSGGTFNFADNTVSNVQGNTSSIALFNFGGAGTFTNNTVSDANDAIASNWSKGSVYSGNTVTNSGSGIHTDNNGGQGGVADLIHNNTVSNSTANGYGIWVFAPQRSVTVKDNLVSNVDVGLAVAGQYAAVNTVFSGNTIDGQNKPNSTGAYVTTTIWGYDISNVNTSFTNNIIRNTVDGFYLESDAGTTLTLDAHNNFVSANSHSNVTQAVGAGGAGSFNANMECNWWGTAGAAGIASSISGAGVDYGPWLSDGTDNDLATAGFQPGGSCVNAISNAQVTAVVNVTCAGTPTGSATIGFDNGFGSVTYSVNGGTAVAAGGSPFTINGLTAGAHTITLTDGGGNAAQVTATITEPAPITVVYSATPILCHGGLSTESITINGGTAPYTVTNQGGGALVIGVASGVTSYGSTYATNYTYTVTDANGCQKIFSVNIPEPAPITVVYHATPILCHGGLSTESITINGGTAPYTVTNQGGGALAIGVARGVTSYGSTYATSYTYTVTDANGCQYSFVANIPEPPALQVSSSATTIVCNGTSTVTVTASGGTAPYSGIGNFSVSAGTYTYTVTDANGCSATTTVTPPVIIDNIFPAITAPGAYHVVNDPGKCEAKLVNIGTPVTSDNCGVAMVWNDHPSPYFPVGTTIVTWKVKDLSGNVTDTAKQKIFVMDNEMPTISIDNISVNNTPGACSATVNPGTPQTADNCGVASVGNDHPSAVFPVGTTYVTWTVTDTHGWTNTVTQTVTVVDNQAPVITGAGNLSFCTNGSSNYTIPAISIAENCSLASVGFNITGATTRSGTGGNASGSFSTGVSYISWTATDVNGNTGTVTSTVTVTAVPAVVITVSNADAFCNKITLTANGGSGAAYQWLSGSIPFSNQPQVSLGQAQGDGLYSVTVTVNGCTSAPAAYLFQKQVLVSSYTILAFEGISLGENNVVASGSVGVTSSKGEVDLQKNSSVASPGSFVKAKSIDKHGSNITIANPIYSAASGVVLPTMYLNTASINNLPSITVNQNTTATLNGNYKTLTLKKGSNTLLNGTIFGTIKVEQGAQVRFSATTINIDKLTVDKGPKTGYSYIRFAPNTKVLVSTSVSIGSQVYVNPDNNKVTFYMGDKKSDEEKFSVKGGDTRITANIYVPNGKLKVTGGYSYGNGDCDDRDDDKYYGQGNSYVYMTGLFIAEEVEGNGKNVTWNSFDCNSLPVPVVTSTTSTQMVSIEKAASDEDLKITVLPNPSTTYFTLKLESRFETPVSMRVMDGGGRVVDARSKIGSNSTIQVGHQYSSGTYYAELIQGNIRKVVQLVKARG